MSHRSDWPQCLHAAEFGVFASAGIVWQPEPCISSRLVWDKAAAGQHQGSQYGNYCCYLGSHPFTYLESLLIIYFSSVCNEVFLFLVVKELWSPWMFCWDENKRLRRTAEDSSIYTYMLVLHVLLTGARGARWRKWYFLKSRGRTNVHTACFCATKANVPILCWGST